MYIIKIDNQFCCLFYIEMDIKKDLSSDIWGPSTWIFLHSITYSYPERPSETTKLEYMQFLEQLKYILPCEKCRMHYTENIQKNPPKLDNRESFVEWMIDLHNQVNIQNNKKKLSYEEVHKIYNKKYSSELFELKSKNTYNDNDYEIILILLIMVTISFILWKVIKVKK